MSKLRRGERPSVEDSQISEWHPYRLPIGPVGRLATPTLPGDLRMYLLEFLGHNICGDPAKRRAAIAALWEMR